MSIHQRSFFRARRFLHLHAVLLGILALIFFTGPAPLLAAGGRVIGTITADRGEVRGFRVKARDTVNRIMYTTFTKAGRYRFVDLPASDYEIWVLQQGYESPVEGTQIDRKSTRLNSTH